MQLVDPWSVQKSVQKNACTALARWDGNFPNEPSRSIPPGLAWPEAQQCFSIPGCRDGKTTSSPTFSNVMSISCCKSTGMGELNINCTGSEAIVRSSMASSALRFRQTPIEHRTRFAARGSCKSQNHTCCPKPAHRWVF